MKPTMTRGELRVIADTDHVQCGDAAAMANMLLSVMDNKPVAWIVHARQGDMLTSDGDFVANAEGINGIRSTPLYTVPPAPVAVPDDGREQFEAWVNFHLDDEHSIVTLHRANGGLNYRDPHVDLAWIAWKESRGAMLQGDENAVPLTTLQPAPELDSSPKNDESHSGSSPAAPDERAAFNAWNNEDNLPIAGVGAKNAAWLAWQARAAMLNAGPVTAATVPDGWKLVPVEPTAEMCKAGYEAQDKWRSEQCDNFKERRYSFSQPRYKAMIDAAPEAPVDDL